MKPIKLVGFFELQKKYLPFKTVEIPRQIIGVPEKIL